MWRRAGELRRAPESSGELRRASDSSGEPQRALESSGSTRRAAESHGEPRRAPEILGELRGALEGQVSLQSGPNMCQSCGPWQTRPHYARCCRVPRATSAKTTSSEHLGVVSCTCTASEAERGGDDHDRGDGGRTAE
eukprot:3512545-Alexandrium_andersonii.AAC.1